MISLVLHLLHTTLRTREIRIITVVTCVDYFSSALVFYGLNLNGTNFSADPFVYMILGGLMEVPSYSLTAPIIARFGRKKPIVLGYFISGVSILALAFIPLSKLYCSGTSSLWQFDVKLCEFSLSCLYFVECRIH